MKPKVVLIILGVVVVVAFILFTALPTRAEGWIKSCRVVDGVGYTLTVARDGGSEIEAAFPGGELLLGARCEVRRKHFLTRWVFARYIPDVDPRD